MSGDGDDGIINAGLPTTSSRNFTHAPKNPSKRVEYAGNMGRVEMPPAGYLQRPQ
ncbi:unnamed protein product [Ectocarpus sp. CCAP 1310/34]|nr:unnamed protein product [Ectocarpus sp. CCAP 1310/34]